MRAWVVTLAVPYAVARVSLGVMDRSIMQKLPPGALLRTAFDHGVGTADHWFGLIVADDSIIEGGRARIEFAGRFEGRRAVDVVRGRTLPVTKAYAITRRA